MKTELGRKICYLRFDQRRILGREPGFCVSHIYIKRPEHSRILTNEGGILAQNSQSFRFDVREKLDGIMMRQKPAWGSMVSKRDRAAGFQLHHKL